MIKSLQETRQHISETQGEDIGKEKIKKYRVDSLLSFLGWPIRSADDELEISFNTSTPVEQFDYHLRNQDGFRILVEVSGSSSLEDKSYNPDELDSHGNSLIISTDGINYNISFYMEGDITNLFSSNILKDDSKWFLNFIGSESIRNGRTEQYAEQIAIIEKDREAIKLSIDESAENLKSTQLPRSGLDKVQHRLMRRLDDKIDEIRSKFLDVSYGASKGYNLEDVVGRFNELILVVSKGGLGIEEYAGIGGTWCSGAFNDSNISYLAVKDPDSKYIRYVLDVEKVVEREEFERMKNVDLSDTEWYNEGEKLIKVSQMYALTDSYVLSEEYADSEAPLTVDSSELIQSDVKF